MKLKHVLSLALLAFVATTVVVLVVRQMQGRSSAASQVSAGELPRAVVAYCFHGAERCATCDKIEALSHQALKEKFAAELGDGRLVWRVENFETPENAAKAKRYEIITSGIVLVDARDPGNLHWKNLQQEVWSLAMDEDDAAFKRFIQAETQAMLQP